MATLAQVYAPIELPPSQPRAYGLFSVASPVGGGEQWRVGVGAQPGQLVEAEKWRDACLAGDPDTEPLVATEWDKSVLTFDPYALYLVTDHSGIDSGLAESGNSDAFEAAEERAVERELWERMSAVATDAGTQADPLTALAVVEARLAAAYGGARGVIHMSPFTATLLHDALSPSGSVQFTKAAGTPVVIGAGYGDALVPTVEIVGTGGVFVRRGEIAKTAAWTLSTNDFTAVAQRDYLTGWDRIAIKTEA